MLISPEMTEQTSLNLSSSERTAGRAISVLLQIRNPKLTALPDFVKHYSTREGKTRREATRCLKRYLARNLYRLLEHPPTTT